jgi:COMPASS component SWD2
MLKYECEGEFEWTHLKFSPNGKMILVSTNTSLILLVDAFSGVLLHTFTVIKHNL